MTKPSEMNKGDMFLYLPTYENGIPEVFVKVENSVVRGVNCTIFVKNSALIRHLVYDYELAPWDNWAIGDKYYETKVGEGVFIPIDDIREVEKYCPDFKLDFE